MTVPAAFQVSAIPLHKRPLGTTPDSISRWSPAATLTPTTSVAPATLPTPRGLAQED